MSKATVFALCFGLLTASASAGSISELSSEKYVLPQNGLEVILHEDHSLPIVAVNLWYHAGPINEPRGRSGFAHLFEHLMFQGSKHVGDDKHFELLSNAGASTINGTTDYDRTNYFTTLPVNQLELALWLESDRMGFLLDTLTIDKLQNQRDVVMNERRQTVENRPYGPSDEVLVHTVFPPDHPYYGAIIGSMSDLEAASLADVQGFFTKYYAPANATLVIAGDIDPDATRAMVDKHFGGLPRREAPAKQGIATPPITGQRRVEVPEPVMLPMIQIAWLSPPLYAPGDAEADVLAYILGAGKSSRMYKRLVYELELAQSVDVHQESNALASLFHVSVTGRPGVDPDELEREIWAVLSAVREQATSDREVTRARNMLITRSLSALQRIGTIADRLNVYNQYIGQPAYLVEDLARYDRVTVESLRTFAQQTLDPDHAVVVETVPQGPAEGQP